MQSGGYEMPYSNPHQAAVQEQSAQFFGRLGPPNEMVPPGRAQLLPETNASLFINYVPYHHGGREQYGILEDLQSSYHPYHLDAQSPGQQRNEPRAFALPPPVFPDAGTFLRNEYGIPDDVPLNLWALPDEDPAIRPGPYLHILAELAIYGSPSHKATLHEIRSAIQERYSFFQGENQKQFNGSLRHLLSFHSIFAKLPRQPTEPGHGEYWTLDIRHAYETKRPRKRRNPRSGTVSVRHGGVRRPESVAHVRRNDAGSASPSSSSSHVTPTPEPESEPSDSTLNYNYTLESAHPWHGYGRPSHSAAHRPYPSPYPGATGSDERASPQPAAKGKRRAY